MTTPIATSEPTRLREEHGENSSSLERALLRAGSSYKTSPHTRAKVLAGLGLAAGSSALLDRIGGGLRVGVGCEADLDQAAARCVAGRRDGGARRLLRSAQRGVEQGCAGLACGDAVPRGARIAAGAGGARAMLSEELGALDRARLSLANGDARRALDELDGYDRRFPGGRLQLEAEVMRIDAFAKVGRKDVARQHADTFLRRHPTSVLATRVRAHLAD